MKPIRLFMALFAITGLACAKKTVIVENGSTAKADVTLSACLLPDPGQCNTIGYITQASTTPTADPSFQLGVFDAFANGSGVGVSCDTAADQAECLADVRAFLIAACDNEVDDDPPIYAKKYVNPSGGVIHADLDGMNVNFTFTEIICQFGQSRIN